MREERMAILKMIENGKITADEGVKLLNAINSGTKKSDVISDVKNRVTKFAKGAEPKVKAVAGKVADKSMEIGAGVKKKVEEKIAESKHKDKIYEAKEKAEEVIEDIVDDVKDIFEDDIEDDIEDDVPESEDKTE